MKEKNIKVIVDIVLNHKAGGEEKEKFQVIKVDPQNREKSISDFFKIESYTIPLSSKSKKNS